MAFAHVRLRLPNGTTATVAPGGIIGRAPTAAARIADPHVSEAHALVSLRGQALHLMALRGSLWVEGVEEDDVPLAEGLHVVLADGIEITVQSVALPDEILALQLPDVPARELCAAVYSLVLGPPADLVPALVADAHARIWSTGEDWNIQVEDRPPETLVSGQSWPVRGTMLRCVGLTLEQASTAFTQGNHELLSITTRFDTVHVHRGRRAPVVITGLPARILSEVAAIGVPASWAVVAREVWPNEDRIENLRALWDRTMRRLRIQLREAGVREDLVRPDGCGNTEICLRPGDRVIRQDD